MGLSEFRYRSQCGRDQARSLHCLPSLLRTPDLIVSLFLMSSSLASGNETLLLDLRVWGGVGTIFRDSSHPSMPTARLTFFLAHMQADGAQALEQIVPEPCVAQGHVRGPRPAVGTASAAPPPLGAPRPLIAPREHFAHAQTEKSLVKNMVLHGKQHATIWHRIS